MCSIVFMIDPPPSLKPLDIHFMKQLHNKVNIVPVIAKADTLTRPEVARLKKKVILKVL